MTTYQTTTPPFYLSSASANALISDFQPTSITPPTLLHINLFLDEILFSLISAAGSLNPSDIRSTGVPAVFSADKSGESTAIRSLGRSAVGEAELELRSWTESNGSVRLGFGKDGNGMKRGGGLAVGEAYGVMRGKCEEFSTLAGEEPADQVDAIERMNAWLKVGGNGDDNVLHPAALYITAILEHVCEHVLQSLARVVGRDSDNTTASLEDLFTAVAEDDGIWGFFKRMQIRTTLEEAIKARQKRSHPSRQADRFGNRPSPDSQRSLVHSSSSGAIRDQEKKSSLPPGYDSRQSNDTSRSVAMVSGSRISPSSSSITASRFGPGISSTRETHNRTPSVLSASTRNMIGAYNDQSEFGGRSRRDEEDDFDALVASGETMKVSLTPSRLKNFDAGRRVTSGGSNQSSLSRRDRPTESSPPRSEELPPLLPRSAQRGPETSQQPPRTTSKLSRNGSNSGLNTQGKLQPRSAAIVTEEEPETEELADELDSPFNHRKRQSEKESLAELLASTGPVPPTAFDMDGGNVKRTVPAVILGSAPPTFDDSPTPSSGPVVGSVNRPERRINPSTTEKRTPAREMADFFDDGPPPPTRGNTGKPKTPAQEMADFFDSTPPPASNSGRYGNPVENVVAPQPKKGLRGLISKISGSGRRGSEEAPPGGISSLTSKEYKAQIKAESQGQEAKRKNSLVGGTTTLTPGQLGAGERRGSSAKSIAEAYRAKQNQGSSPTAPEVPTLAPILPNPPSATTKPTPIATMPRSNSGSSLNGGGPGLTRKTSLRKPVPYASAGSSPEATSSPVIPSAILANTHSIPSTNSIPRRKPSTVDEDINSDAEQDGKTLEGKTSTDQMSFATARETPMTPGVMDDGAQGEDTTPKVVQGALVGGVAGAGLGMLDDRGVDTVPEAAAIRGNTESSHEERTTERNEKIDSVPETSTIRDEIKDDTPSTNPISNTPTTKSIIPSIPLVDIVPLRHLLDGATSVKECQLLLSAILSQWGVPLSSSSSSADEEVDPESRIAAWLLAGRDGPVSDIRPNGTGEKEKTRGEGEIREERLDSEGTAVEKEEEAGPTISGVVTDIKDLAVAGIAKVF